MAEVEVNTPGPGEALVKIVASGVCHTDAIARDGDMPFPPPGVRGTVTLIGGAPAGAAFSLDHMSTL